MLIRMRRFEIFVITPKKREIKVVAIEDKEMGGITMRTRTRGWRRVGIKTKRVWTQSKKNIGVFGLNS